MQEREGEAGEPADDPKAPRERRDPAMAQIRLRSRLGAMAAAKLVEARKEEIVKFLQQSPAAH